MSSCYACGAIPKMILLNRPLLLGPSCLRQLNSLYRLQHVYAACAPGVQSQVSASAPLKPPVTPIFRNAHLFGDRTAIRDSHGDYSYTGIYLSSRQLAGQISEELSGKELERVAFLCPNDASYVITQWACWMSGQIVVPLSSQHPPASLEYFISDSDASLIIATSELAPPLVEIAKKTGRKILVIDDALRALAMKTNIKVDLHMQESDKPEAVDMPSVEQTAGLDTDFYADNEAMIIYTSGTTSDPKGVVLTYKNLEAQARSLIEGWNITDRDVVLHTLPLHHIHGIVNAMMCPLYVGGRCVMLPKFSSSHVWSQLLAIRMSATDRVNVFMGVPTMYVKLIEEYEQIFSANEKMREYIKVVLSNKIRLMTCGSAPLPVTVLHQWENITGHRLLERFGMSETGMVLSNPLNGERKPGFVGTPLPGTAVRIARPKTDQEKTSPGDSGDVVLCEGTSEGTIVRAQNEPIIGNLLVNGPNVFSKYWRRPQTTDEVFCPGRWFRTGDSAQFIENSYKILGRTSVDILKTGGYKVSAVQVESTLLGHPDILDCSVVGVSDLTWGQKVAAVVVARPGAEVLLSEVREWCKDKLPPYAIPTILKVLVKIPRNNLGKVNKVNLVKQVFPEGKLDASQKK